MSSCSASDLCIKCGACCDGTAFGHVPLKANDLAGVSIKMNLLEAEGKRVLMQPCAAHVNNTCTIYEDRPSPCRDYKCKLLKEYINEEVNVRVAHETIEKLRQLRGELETLLKAAGIGTNKDDIHIKMWSLKKHALTTMTTVEFHDLHRPLLSKYDVLKQLLTDSFGVTFSRKGSFE